MLYRKFETATGDYIANDGIRYILATARAMTEEQRPFWTWFDSEEECLAAWGLTYDPLPPTETEPQPEN